MKNTILLAMSTLGKNGVFVEQNNSFVDDTLDGEYGEISNCSGQLEPIVKKMIREKSARELEVIALCTSETVNNIVTVRTDCGTQYETTAIDYFVMRIYKDFFCEEITAIDVEKNWKKFSICGYENTESNACISVVREEKRLKVTRIAIEESNLISGIACATEYIRERYEDEDERPESFWIDTHGGFRDIAMVCNSVISLLRLENETYKPEKIFGVRYATTNKIVSQEETYDIFTFVSGMTAFAKYGDADILSGYFEKIGVDEPVVKGMQLMSNGLRECNLEIYMMGLELFNESIDLLDESDSMLALFKKYIKREYESLVNANLAGIIKYCVRKKMYQQALTFIDTGIPRVLYDNKKVYWEGIKIDGIEVVEPEKISEVLEELKRREKDITRIYLSDINYLFEKLYDKYSGTDLFKIMCSGNGEMRLGKLLDGSSVSVQWIFSKKAYKILSSHKEIRSIRNYVCHSNEGMINEMLNNYGDDKEGLEAKIMTYIKSAS